MAEGGTSSYVKLTKEQDAPLEEIQPGELNQPVRVPQLEFRRCSECRQPLPESYRAPTDEPWTTGIFGCAEDPESCRTGLFCPCMLFANNVQSINEDISWNRPCLCHAIFVEGGIALAALTAIFHGFDPSTSFLIGEGLMFSWWMCGIYTGLFRQSLQRKYHLKNSPCDPCMVHCCLHWCALCQEHREMKARLSDNMVMPMTVVNPPAVQDMNREESSGAPPTSQNGVPSQHHEGLEMSAV